MDAGHSSRLDRRAACLTLGWDIGGVNIKLAVVRDGAVIGSFTRPFEIQRAPHALAAILRDLAAAARAVAEPHGGGSVSHAVVHAVTMTAELSQVFRRKRDGVAFVVEALEDAFPSASIHVAAVDGRFLPPEEARADPRAVAAANWAATARVVAWSHADALLIDVGTTTTDIIPIVEGRIAAAGRTDPERLSSGELVYTGAVRTPVEAIVQQVPWQGTTAGVSAEGFALTGDVYVWRGDLPSHEYTAPAPDGRPPVREFAGERLARTICADREMLDEAAVSAIADAVAAAQRRQIAAAIAQVHRRHPALSLAVLTGIGTFIAERAAQEAGLRTTRLAAPGEPAAAAAVALLLERALASGGATG